VSCSELGDAQVSRTRLRFILGDARGQEMGIGVSRRWLLAILGAVMPLFISFARTPWGKGRQVKVVSSPSPQGER
jgi:hypothetical protein